MGNERSFNRDNYDTPVVASRPYAGKLRFFSCLFAKNFPPFPFAGSISATIYSSAPAEPGRAAKSTPCVPAQVRRLAKSPTETVIAPQGASERERHFPPYSGRDAGCSGLRLFRLQNISACKHFSSKISAIILVGPIRDGSFRGKGGTDSGRGGGGSLLWRKSMSSPFSGTRRAGGTVERRYRAALLCLFYAGITEKTAVFSHAFLPDVQFLVSAC